MTLTKEDRDVLKVLVEKELQHIKKDEQNFLVSNANFITKRSSSDLPFLKAFPLYKKFLKELKKKL